MRTIGLDLGFRQVKVSAEEGFRFDSVIGYPSVMEVGDERDNRHPLQNIVIEHDNELVYVGEKAIRDTKNAQLTFVADKTDHKSDKVKLLSALGYAMGGKNEDAFNIVTGLPVDELGIQGLKEKMIENMQQTFQFAFNNETKTAHVKRVNVIAQSAGAYYDYILDDTGDIIEERIKPKTVVIDIGFRTTDVVCMQDALYNPAESFTVYTGVHNIHLEMRKELLKKYRIQKQPSEIDAIVRSGYVTINGQHIPVKDSILASVQPFAEKILSELPLYIPNLTEVDQFLLAGGGASFMADEFMLPAPTEVLSDSEMANARGYRKYLLLLNRNGK
jgi:hypothetical protein